MAQHEPEPNMAQKISTMAEEAIAWHEVYLSFNAAGFTQPQALYLVGQIATGGRGTPPPEVTKDGS